MISRQKKEHDVLKDQLKLREDCLKKVLHYDKKLPSLYGSKKHYEEQNKPVPVALEQRIERNLKKQSDAHSKYEKVNWSTYVKLSEFFDQKEQVLQSLYTDWLHAESLFLNSFGDNIREVQSVFTNPTQLGIQALDFPIVSNRRSVDRKPHWYSGIFQPTS